MRRGGGGEEEKRENSREEGRTCESSVLRSVKANWIVKTHTKFSFAI